MKVRTGFHIGKSPRIKSRDDYERPSLNQLKRYILYCCAIWVKDARCAASADLKMVARHRPLDKKMWNYCVVAEAEIFYGDD